MDANGENSPPEEEEEEVLPAERADALGEGDGETPLGVECEACGGCAEEDGFAAVAMEAVEEDAEEGADKRSCEVCGDAGECWMGARCEEDEEFWRVEMEMGVWYADMLLRAEVGGWAAGVATEG